MVHIIYSIMSYVYFETTFEDIYDIWDKELWPERKSKIEKMSALRWNAGLWKKHGKVSITKDRSIFDNYTPTFWGIKNEGEIIGVNSGFRTSDRIYRSRGLYIKPERRKKGLSNLLLKLTLQIALKENCKMVWTMPRKSALFAYESVGFQKIGNWIEDDVEFGPNCVAIRVLQ
jgi:GNAT superfamily N-acetyltransferase